MTKEHEAVVAQYGWLNKLWDRERGGDLCVFHSVHVGASVDAVVVLERGPVEMTAVLVGASFLRGEHDGVIAGIGGRQSPKLLTMAGG